MCVSIFLTFSAMESDVSKREMSSMYPRLSLTSSSAKMRKSRALRGEPCGSPLGTGQGGDRWSSKEAPEQVNDSCRDPLGAEKVRVVVKRQSGLSEVVLSLGRLQDALRQLLTDGLQELLYVVCGSDDALCSLLGPLRCKSTHSLSSKPQQRKFYYPTFTAMHDLHKQVLPSATQLPAVSVSVSPSSPDAPTPTAQVSGNMGKMPPAHGSRTQAILEWLQEVPVKMKDMVYLLCVISQSMARVSVAKSAQAEAQEHFSSIRPFRKLHSTSATFNNERRNGYRRPFRAAHSDGGKSPTDWRQRHGGSVKYHRDSMAVNRQRIYNGLFRSGGQIFMVFNGDKELMKRLPTPAQASTPSSPYSLSGEIYRTAWINPELPHLVFLPQYRIYNSPLLECFDVTPRTIPIERVISHKHKTLKYVEKEVERWVLSEKILERRLKVEGFLRAVLKWLCDKTRDLYPQDYRGVMHGLPVSFGYTESYHSPERLVNAVLESRNAFLPLLSAITMRVLVLDASHQPQWRQDLLRQIQIQHQVWDTLEDIVTQLVDAPGLYHRRRSWQGSTDRLDLGAQLMHLPSMRAYHLELDDDDLERLRALPGQDPTIEWVYVRYAFVGRSGWAERPTRTFIPMRPQCQLAASFLLIRPRPLLPANFLRSRLEVANS
ncbi:hypothetical protein GGX14DRAFT_404482 [Mycena pura]|uniref:Uncharacterized protein n=1 Tax=Mycena pura TaxID=153505 RepID=A0AAD6UTZ1_9AGAR|nr:hypothetical protein GGX14DRAFT_404482 [Mycena pura]